MSSSRTNRGKNVQSSDAYDPNEISWENVYRPVMSFDDSDDDEEHPTETPSDIPTQGGATQESETQVPATQYSMPPRPLKSQIMTVHFTKVRTESDPNLFDVTCNYCQKAYKYRVGGGYGSFRNHVQRHHPDKWGNDTSQTQIQVSSTRATRGTSSSNLFSFDNTKYRKGLAKMICAKGLPFNFANDDIYENFTKLTLQPASRRVPRTTVTRDVMVVMNEFKYELINYFGNLSHKVSICADIWSDHWERHSYLGITAHWIDSSWVMQKRLIAYRDFDIPHTAANIAQKLQGILNEFCLLNKVCSIGFDNASNNTASLPDLIRFCQPALGGKFFHIRCMSHIINLCVQDGLAHLRNEVTPIRNAVSYIARYSSVKKKWERFLKFNKVKVKYFSLDVPNRWNSTYKMLDESNKYKDAICQFLQSVDYPDTLFPHQWDACSNLRFLLKVFNDATNLVSGIYYPTSDKVLDVCCQIAVNFTTCIDCPVLGDCVKQMKIKWLKYFLEIPSIFLVAKVLDPRVRLDGLEELLTVYYENLFPQSSPHFLDTGAPTPESIVNSTKTILLDYYREYHTMYGARRTNPDAGISTGGGGSSTGGGSRSSQEPDDFMSRFYDKRKRRPASSSSSTIEVDTYLNTTFEVTEEADDILMWWSKRANMFPILSLIAKEVLSTPASTVAVEQAFSIGGNVLDDRRSCLTVEHLEAQCLVGDWVKAENRAQEFRIPSEEEEEENTSSSGTGTSCSD